MLNWFCSRDSSVLTSSVGRRTLCELDSSSFYFAQSEWVEKSSRGFLQQAIEPIS